MIEITTSAYVVSVFILLPNRIHLKIFEQPCKKKPRKVVVVQTGGKEK